MSKEDFYKSIAVIDTETTSLYAAQAEIVEYAKSYYSNGSWITTSSLLGAKDGIPPEASAKNMISNRMIKGLPTFPEVVEDVKLDLGWGYRKYWVAHNSKYDQEVLFKAFTDSNLPEDAAYSLDKSNWICTFKLAKQLLDFDFSDMKYNLSFLRYKLDLPVSDELGVHRAAADTIVTAALLEFLVEYAITKGIVDETLDIGKQLNNLCWKPTLVTKWPFGKHKGTLLSETPTDYYVWALKNMDKLKDTSPDYDPDLSESIRIELEKRLSV